ncbi:MAG: DUF5610 domain-containing protein [Gammaproteobacteria bacterium]
MFTQSLKSSVFPFHSLTHPLNHVGNTTGGHLRAGPPVANHEASMSSQRFQKVVDRHLLDTLEKAIGIEGISLKELNPGDFTPQKVADRVLNFVNQALGLMQNSRPDFDRDAFLSEVKEGIDTGFEEARDILNGLGVLNGQIEDTIGDTYDLIQQGLSKLESGDPSPSLSTVSLKGQSAKINRSTQIEMTTQEGDVITIALEQTLSKHQAAFNIEQNDTAISGFQSSFAGSSRLIINIEGDLNEDEQDSLKQLLKQMDKVGHAFFQGNIQAAFHHVGKLEIDSRTIAGVSMNLEMSRTVQAIAAYQQTRLPDQSVQMDRIKQVSDFFNQARELLDSARSTLATFENPLSAFADLFAGVAQTGSENVVTQDVEASGQLMNQLIEPLGRSLFNDIQAVSV